MRCDPADLQEVAQRIASTENSLAKLQVRIERLHSEGSDASQAREHLALMQSNLGQLYSKQTTLRRGGWAMNR
jgi:hypothetical protein